MCLSLLPFHTSFQTGTPTTSTMNTLPTRLCSSPSSSTVFKNALSIPWTTQSRTLAGHSHYHNTRHRKASVDSKKSASFSKLGRELYASIAAGGSDASSNPRLKRALGNARRLNMPKSRIDRALAASTSNKNSQPAIYDMVLPKGIAVRVSALQLRVAGIAAELRSLSRRAGGDLSKAHHFFHEQFSVIVPQHPDLQMEDVILKAIEDCQVSDFMYCEDGAINFSCQSLKDRDSLANILKSQVPVLHELIFVVRELQPTHIVDVHSLGDEVYKKTLNRLFEALDEHPEVVQVIHNANI